MKWRKGTDEDARWESGWVDDTGKEREMFNEYRQQYIRERGNAEREETWRHENSKSTSSNAF